MGARLFDDKDQPAVLEYAKPETPAPSRFTVARVSVAVGLVVLVLGLSVPASVGSGSFNNPLRTLAVVGISFCGVLYVWARVYADEVEDCDKVTLRGSLYRLLILVMPIVLLFLHHDWNRGRRVGVLSIENPYFQLVLAIFALACLIAALRHVWKRSTARLRRRRERPLASAPGDGEASRS